MQRLALAAGWSVVHEVGHAAPVTAILDVPAGLLTADTDGSLYLRDVDGVSVRPPITLPSVSMVTHVPGSSRVVVGTGAGVFTLEPSTGERAAVAGFADGAAVTCGTVAGERVLVGCSDGTLRELHLDAGVDTAGPDTAGPDSPGPDTAGSADAGPGSAGAEVVERFGSAPVALVSCGAEGALGVWLRDGHLGVVGGDGRRSWLAPQQAQAVSAIELVDGHLVWAGTTVEGDGRPRGVVEVRDPAGVLTAETRVSAPVHALARRGDRVLAATAIGEVSEFDLDLAEPRLVGVTQSVVGVSMLAVGAAGEVLVGGMDGTVHCLDGALTLPARPSRVVGLTAHPRTKRLYGVDLYGITMWDRDGLHQLASFPSENACAVSATGHGGEELVVAKLDGSLVRLAAPHYQRVVARAELGTAPRYLGWVGELVIAVTTEGPRAFHATTLEPVAHTPAQLELLAGFERSQGRFRGVGAFAGTVIGIIDGQLHSVYDEPTAVIEVSDAALLHRLVRLWDGNRFLD